MKMLESEKNRPFKPFFFLNPPLFMTEEHDKLDVEKNYISL